MGKKKYQISIIIINYKTPQLIIDCLESLLPELMDLNSKVTIVDNASNDNSLEYLKNWLDDQVDKEKVALIESIENTGFSGGNNLGIREVYADYYLLLNSDTLVRKGAIESLLQAAKADDTAGLISPRLEWKDTEPQESCFKFHSPISELILSAATGPVTNLFRSYVVAQTVREKNGYYEWTSFACVLIKAEVFEDIGLLDDGYFMYFEDVDFCFRARRAGWNILNVPSAHIVHLRGGSSPVKSQTQLRKRLPRYFYESRTRYFYQVYGRLGLFGANILWTIGWGISSLRSLVSPSYFSKTSKSQWRDIWTNFGNPLKSFIHPDNYDKA